MNMNTKKSFFLFLAVCFFSGLTAGVRTPEAAAGLAAGCLNAHANGPHRAPVAAEQMTLAHTATVDGNPALYVFNASQGGFAVISGDDRARAVLCYSPDGAYDPQQAAPAMQEWLRRMASAVAAIEPGYEMPQPARAPQVTPVEPLLGDIAWNQTDPYNRFCPVDDNDNTVCYTGCVATAAAQVMRYWRYPRKGTGTKNYLWHNFDLTSAYDAYTGTYAADLKTETLIVDFGNTEYDWDNMISAYRPGKYTEEQADAVATLMYHCGVAANMYFGGFAAGGSGAYVEDMANGLRDYFAYRYTQILGVYTTPTLEELTTAFNADLEAGRPIILSGASAGFGGHAFVCDGRNADGLFHINWGWSGIGNCYTALSVLEPNKEEMGSPYTEVDMRFMEGLEICIGLEPACRPVNTTDQRTVCASELPFTWNGFEINGMSDNGKKAVLVSVAGCDSIVTLQLSVMPVYNVTDGADVCASELPYAWAGGTFTAAGTKTHTFKTVQGCDSVVTFTLTVLPEYNVTDGATVCASELPYAWAGGTFTAAGTKTHTFKTVQGCDSVVTFTLTVLPEYNVTDGVTVCASELPYAWAGGTFTAAGTKTHTFTSVQGCDSVVTFTLTVLPEYNVTDGATVCASELPYAWAGEMFTAAGTKTHTFTSVQGCDSVVTFTLTVLPEYNVTDGAAVCASELPYAWAGETFNAAGTKTHTFKTVQGCDSVVTFTLTVLPEYNVTDGVTVCASELPYEWTGEMFTAAGTKTHTFKTVQGCDSVVTFTLTVLPTSETTVEEDVIVTESLHGITYDKTGDVKWDDILTNIAGCDSTVHHIVHVLPLPEYTLTVVVDRPEYGTVTGSGTYPRGTQVTLTAVPGEYCRFLGWSDGETDVTRLVEVAADMTYTAMFGPEMYSLTVGSNDMTVGTVNTSFTDDEYAHGTEITLEAVPETGARFVRWSDGSTVNPYVFTLLSDTWLRAIFVEQDEADAATTVSPSDQEAGLAWQTVPDAELYVFTLWLDAEHVQVVVTLTFDADGMPLDGEVGSPSAFLCTLLGLNAETSYYYRMRAFGAGGQILDTEEGAFVTDAVPTALGTCSGEAPVVKWVRDGQLFILRNGVLYDAEGRPVR